jgi:hypothetical protein
MLEKSLAVHQPLPCHGLDVMLFDLFCYLDRGIYCEVCPPEFLLARIKIFGSLVRTMHVYLFG